MDLPDNARGHTHNQARCTTHWTHLRAELREAEDSSGELAGAADLGSGSPGKGREGKAEVSAGCVAWRRRGEAACAEAAEI
jgi:hypothetical protein